MPAATSTAPLPPPPRSGVHDGVPALRAVSGPAALADALRGYRREHRLTVRDAGRAVGGSHWVWAQWERGVVPGPVYLRRLADLLGLAPGEVRALAGPDRVRRATSVGDEHSHGLARARVDAGLSAAELARRLHVSAALVSRWESGERIPGRHYWPPIAAALGRDLGFVEALYVGVHAPSETVDVSSLHHYRRARGLGQADLAAAVGADVTSIQRWERQRRAPRQQACRLAWVLRLDLETLAAPAPERPAVHPVDSPLRRLRRRRGLPTRVLAARVGVSRSALLAWERGCTRPSWADARRLARALSASVDEVFAAGGLASPRHLDPSRWTVEALPAILTDLRRWHGLTQDDLGALVGVGAGAVRGWEQGRHRPRLDTLSRLDHHLATSGRLVDLLARRRGSPR